VRRALLVCGSLTGVGVPWSNFVGIWFFHSGNTIDALGMASGLGFKQANLPSVGMWVFWSATWLLVVADTASWLSMPTPLAPGVETGMSPTGVISPLQIAGASLLAVGSVMYTAWVRARRITDGVARALFTMRTLIASPRRAPLCAQAYLPTGEK
jgi:hypothetical protein